MIGRLRGTIPASYLAPLAGAYLLFEGPVLFAEWRFGQPLLNLKVRPGTFLIFLAAGCYGVLRVVLTHPFYLADYRRWLELTPWTVEKPLPGGPVELVWEDGLLLGLLLLLFLTQHPHDSIRVINVFLVGNLAALAWSFFGTGEAPFAYLVLFGLGLAVRFSPKPWIFFAIASATYLVAYEGLRRSLARFPWPPWDWIAINLGLDAERGLGPACGWPHDRMLRDIRLAERNRINRLDGLLVSLLIGFWLFCGQALIADARNRMLLPVFGLWAVPVLATQRLALYARGLAPPISFLGRIRTGQLIVPGNDRVYLAPLLTLLAVPAVLGPCWGAGVPGEISLPAAISAAFAVALLTPPRLRDWRLTAQARMFWPPTVQGPKSEFLKVG
jgi:hypothetical protein